jgi:hypothetical protein
MILKFVSNKVEDISLLEPRGSFLIYTLEKLRHAYMPKEA